MPVTYELNFNWSNYLRGGNNSETIRGSSASEILNGRGGADSTYGGGGDDIHIIGSSADKVFENAGEGVDWVLSWTGSYTLPSNVENLRIEGNSDNRGYGNELDNVILGNSGDNTIEGRAGNDLIIGGAGEDNLWGGTGNDGFVVASAENGVDTIHDFEVGADWLDLGEILQSSVKAEAVASPTTGSSGPVTKTIEEVTLVPVSTTTSDGADLKYGMPISKSSYRVIDLDKTSSNIFKLGSNENVMFLGSDKVETSAFKVEGGNHIALIGGTFKPGNTSHPGAVTFKGYKGSLYIEGTSIDNSRFGYGDGLRVDPKDGTRTDLIIQNTSIENVTGAKKSGAHGDVIQPLGPIDDIKIYNFTGSTTYQGLFFSNQPSRSGAHINGVDLENVNLKYNGGSKSYALWFERGQDVKFENVYVEERPGYSAQSWSVWPPGASRSGDTLNLNKFGFKGNIKVGNPPGGDFVKASDVGAGYEQGSVTKTEYKEVITTKTVVVDEGSSDAVDPSAGSDNPLKFIQEGANTVVYVDDNGNGKYTKLITLKNVNAEELAAAYNADEGVIPTDNPANTEDPADDPTDQPPPAEDPPAEDPPAEDPPAETPDDGGQAAGNRPELQEIPDIELLDPDNWIRGTDRADKLYGSSRDDYINGRGKADTLTGKQGDDNYNVDSVNDVIVERAGEGTDTVISWSIDYTLGDNVEHARLKRDGGKLTGNELDNIVLGSRFDNTISTKDGDDILIGADGDDTLTGGEGSDIFVYEDTDEGRDVITDFTIGDDIIDLRALNIDLADLEIKSSAGDAVIYVNNQQLATLEQVSAEQLSATDDFWF